MVNRPGGNQFQFDPATYLEMISAEMLAAASGNVAADLRVSRLEEPLPKGNFDLVVSALAVHHLDGWLAAAGLDTDVVWVRQDLVVIVADSPS